jgi:hypothetical protein
MVVTFARSGMDLSHATGIFEVAQSLLLAQLYINESLSNERFKAVA